MTHKGEDEELEAALGELIEDFRHQGVAPPTEEEP